ncbi:MAG: transporter [Burkholderiales bacterium PBB6]|nr:MAG: transporter [Burkholderiales bacterium PBB6]
MKIPITSCAQALCRRTLLVGVMLVMAGCAIQPKPIDPAPEAVQAQIKLKALIASEEPLKGPLSLYEAMARALKYNLDQKIEVMDEALRFKKLDLAGYDMLPAVVASTGYSRRNNDAGGRSRSLVTGNQSLEASTSSDRGVRTSDLTASWDVLDFGLAYVRGMQAADETLIAVERRRKVTNRILEDVRTAFWRAVSADRTFKKLSDVETLALRALRESEELEARGLVPPLALLAYQRDLIQTQSEAQRLRRELSLAKTQLAALINLTPETEFTLLLPDRTNVVPELPGAADEMVLTGLRFRPEMREAAYRRHINTLEQEGAFLRSLPSVKSLLGLSTDSNSYLANGSWLNMSARVSWNLLEVFRYPAQKAALQAESAVLEQRDLALTMAVATQVQVSRIRFVKLSQELNSVRRANSVQERILELSRRSFKAKAVSQQNLVREEFNAALSEVRYDAAYADLQNAYANLYASMGLDNFEIDVKSDTSIDQIAALLESHWTERALTLPAMPESKP